MAETSLWRSTEIFSMAIQQINATNLPTTCRSDSPTRHNIMSVIMTAVDLHHQIAPPDDRVVVVFDDDNHDEVDDDDDEIRHLTPSTASIASHPPLGNVVRYVLPRRLNDTDDAASTDDDGGGNGGGSSIPPTTDDVAVSTPTAARRRRRKSPRRLVYLPTSGVSFSDNGSSIVTRTG